MFPAIALIPAPLGVALVLFLALCHTWIASIFLTSWLFCWWFVLNSLTQEVCFSLVLSFPVSPRPCGLTCGSKFRDDSLQEGVILSSDKNTEISVFWEGKKPLILVFQRFSLRDGLVIRDA